MALMKRTAGVLCPIFSLPNAEGIGTLGYEAYRFIDFLSNSQQTYWQILPIGVTSYGDSPYQSFSSYAGNPYFIDLNFLIDEGLLDKSDLEQEWGDPQFVEYDRLWQQKYPLLRKAFKKANFKNKVKDSFQKFPWLEDYATFMALKYHYDGTSRVEWPEGSIKSLLSESTKKSLTDEIAFHTFLQVIFFQQWTALKSYANENNISIIGDLPIFVSNDSADVWANPEYFCLDKQGNSTEVAGVPPDYFSETGQLWGNPLYNWEKLKHDNFTWWIDRILTNLELYDVIRIDHFRGFESYWSVPQGEETAVNGRWIKAYGKELFDILKQKHGSLPIIAEDLGFITPEVHELIDHTGFPGMCVLQFAFDYQADNPYKPENIKTNRVVYTGTHDNNTSVGWFLDPQNHESVEYLKHNYWHTDHIELDNFIVRFIEMAFASSANIAIIPIQDILGLDQESRINIPSTVGNNWKWRLTYIPTSYQKFLKNLTEQYQRI